MAEMNKINSFKSFTEIRNAANTAKLREENQTKRKELAQKFESILDEMGITSFDELDEETQNNFINKVLGKELNERNAFLGARAKAIEEDREDFEFNGKTYKVTTKSDVSEGNAFGDAVRKAKEAGEKEFEFEGKTYKVTESITEAIKVEGKRDAKKVVTVYNKIFNKVLVDLGAMPTESILGCIKYLMNEAMIDANFHREAAPVSKMIKGNIQPLEIKMPGLGGHFIKVGAKTIKTILDKYYSDIANAAGWGGQGIAEGTALYLEQIKQEAMGQAVINKFNSQFEGEEIRVDVEARINEAKVLEAAAWEIGKDYPSYGVVVGVTHNDDLCEVSFDNGQKIVFRDAGEKWVQESVVTEAAVKRFEMDLKDMIKDIKRGYGWIDPEFVEDTWENTSDTIDFKIVKAEVYKRLIAAGILAYADEENEEEAGKHIKSLKELGIKESAVTESEAVNILNDLLDERGGDMGELHGMSIEDAQDTVEAYGHKGSKAKKIAQELHSLCNESVVTEAKFDKKSLMKAMKKDDGIILVNGQEYIIYNPDNGNDENAEMWGDKTIFALDQDGEEHEFKYSDIERFSESVVTEAEIKSDEEFQEYAFTVLKKAFGDDFEEEKGQEIVDGILSKSDGDYGAAVGMLTSSLG